MADTFKFVQHPIRIAVLAVTTVACYAQTFTTVASFTGTNGDHPGGQYGAPLVQGPDGSLYGTTQLGGMTLNGLQAGFGVVFKLATNGTLTSLYAMGTGASDGAVPSSGLILGSDGNFYGVDQDTIFKITPGGTFTALVTPTESSSLNLNGYFNAIIQGTDGNFYGTTGGDGSGSVFKMTPSGTLTVLYNFTAAGLYFADTGLVEGSDGNFYGSTENGPNGQAIYKITPQGALTPLAVTHADVEGPLIQASDGNFYGVTGNGGAYSRGSVFRMTPAGVLTTVYSFCAQTGCPDGNFPSGGLIQGQDGNLYGTSQGGYDTKGTIFQLTLGGTLTTLHSFCALLNCTDGETPQGPLFQASNGTFYGTTVAGGTSPYSYGSVFSLQLNAQNPNAFFVGEDSLGSGVYYLQFSDGNPFGYYGFLQGSAASASAWLYHFDLGYEYVTAGDSNGDLYFYDLASTHWWYSSSSLFPYLYDFTLNSWLYYFPNTKSPGHYTTNPRSFSNLTTGKIFTM